MECTCLPEINDIFLKIHVKNVHIYTYLSFVPEYTSQTVSYQSHTESEKNYFTAEIHLSGELQSHMIPGFLHDFCHSLAILICSRFDDKARAEHFISIFYEKELVPIRISKDESRSEHKESRCLFTCANQNITWRIHCQSL